jgi:hypothetical protein
MQWKRKKEESNIREKKTCTKNIKGAVLYRRDISRCSIVSEGHLKVQYCTGGTSQGAVLYQRDISRCSIVSEGHLKVQYCIGGTSQGAVFYRRDISRCIRYINRAYRLSNVGHWLLSLQFPVIPFKQIDLWLTWYVQDNANLLWQHESAGWDFGEINAQSLLPEMQT